MGERVIRTAVSADVDTLAALKADYVRGLYRGFLSEAVLKRKDASDYRDQFVGWLENQQLQLDVLLLDGQAVGYVVFGKDLTEEGFGLIWEAALSLACVTTERDTLLMHAIETLARMGYERIHMWVLRDNFRVRFFCEQFGFKADGARRMVEHDGQELQIARYLYRTRTYR